MREYEGTTNLQGLGEVQGIQAKNLQVGDYQVWNYGSSSEIINIETTKTGKTLIVTYKWFNKHARVENERWIGEWQEQIRKFRATSIVVVKELNPVQEVLEVKQIRQESEELLSFMNVETLETQKESLEAISKQLDKVNEAIEKNIDNEEIRLQLRDIENNLKYNYSGLCEMIEQQEKIKNSIKIQVTHNEYEKIMQELASRVWETDETKITMKEYDQMLENYEVLPFEINTDNEELKKIINIYADNESIEADRTVYRGSIDKSILYNLLNDSIGYKDLYIEYYQMIICNNELKSILTYCEGDFIAEVYNSESEYNAGIERTKNFIEEM